jgi:type I restriction-modification system DNA methylase subunit
MVKEQEVKEKILQFLNQEDPAKKFWDFNPTSPNEIYVKENEWVILSSNNKSGTEEYIRAFFTVYLVRVLGFNKLKVGEIVTKSFGKSVIKSEADIQILDETGKLIILIELKIPDLYNITNEQDIKGQLYNVLDSDEFKKHKKNFKKFIYGTIDIQGDNLVPKVAVIDYKEFKDYDEWVEHGRPHTNILPTKFNLDDFALYINLANRNVPEVNVEGVKLRNIRSNIDYKHISNLVSKLHHILWGGSKDYNSIFSHVNRVLLAKYCDERYLTKKYYESEIQSKTTEDILTYIRQIDNLVLAYHELFNQLKTLDGEELEKCEQALKTIADDLAEIPICKFQVISFKDKTESLENFAKRIELLYREAQRNLLNLPLKNQAKSSLSQDLVNTSFLDTNHFNYKDLEFTVSKFQDINLTECIKVGKKDVLGRFYEKLMSVGFKQSQAQFFTHHNITRFILYVLKLDELAYELFTTQQTLPFIIDPSCGSGTFLIDAMDVVTEKITTNKSDIIRKEAFAQLYDRLIKNNEWVKTYIYGIEKNYDLGMASKLNMFLHGDGSMNIFIDDGLQHFDLYTNRVRPQENNRENILRSTEEDKLYNNKKVNKQFQVCISNPPFSLKKENFDPIKDMLKKNYLYGDKYSSENLFFERWYQLLDEKGRLGVVMPEATLDTKENLYIRIFMFKYFNIKAIVSLPQGVFVDTPTKTSLIFAQKKTKVQVNQWITEWDSNIVKYLELMKSTIAKYVKSAIDVEKKLNMLLKALNMESVLIKSEYQENYNLVKHNKAAYDYFQILMKKQRSKDQKSQMSDLRGELEGSLDIDINSIEVAVTKIKVESEINALIKKVDNYINMYDLRSVLSKEVKILNKWFDELESILDIRIEGSNRATSDLDTDEALLRLSKIINLFWYDFKDLFSIQEEHDDESESVSSNGEKSSGKYSIWWVFKETYNKLGKNILYADVENVGFKWRKQDRTWKDKDDYNKLFYTEKEEIDKDIVIDKIILDKAKVNNDDKKLLIELREKIKWD